MLMFESKCNAWTDVVEMLVKVVHTLLLIDKNVGGV